MANHHISRRTMLAGSAAAGAMALTGMPAFADIEWKKYAGTKLEVILAKGPRGDNLQKYIKEFTELSGIQVEFGADPGTAAAPEARHRARLRQAELRRHPSQLSRAEAAVRQGRLARRPDAVPEGPEPHAAGPRRHRFLRRRPAIRQERQGAACCRCRGRSTTSSSTTTRSCSRRRASRCPRRWMRW